MPLPNHKSIELAFVNVGRTFATPAILNKKLTSEQVGRLFSLIQSQTGTEVRPDVIPDYRETIILIMEHPKGGVFRISLLEETLDWPKPFFIAIGTKLYRVDKQEGKRNFRSEIERICQIPPETLEIAK